MNDKTPSPDGLLDGPSLHRQRAHLLGGYAAMFGAVFSLSDPLQPNTPVLYIESPKGQLSWHIDPADKDLFEGLKVPMVDDYPWDGHTTAEKYLRVQALNLEIPKLTHIKPEYRKP